MGTNDVGKREPFAPVADFIIRMRWAWLGLTAVLIALSLAQIANIFPPNPDARIFFAEENPDRVALDRFEATFNKNENLMIVIAPNKAFNSRTL